MTRHDTTDHEEDLATLAASGYTGWWDEHGQPAPFPLDFFDPDSDWRPSSSDIPTMLADDEQPF
ncbi:hypothetical protein FXB39_08345 [Nocardioides sp. BGMRC 2183]|nr:hypothetical protein FXB39_08345 [Nocardioides sp. BGMRC 2183]